MPDSASIGRLRRDRLIIWSFVLCWWCLVACCFAISWSSRHRHRAAEAQRQLRTVTLYFAAADGSGLVAEGREIADCLVEIDCLQGTCRPCSTVRSAA